MKLSDAIEGFFICKTGNRKGDFSPKTIRLYQHLLSNLTKTLEDPEVKNVTFRNLEQFMADLAKPERGLSPYAQDNYYKAIRSFWNWAVESVNAAPVHLDLRQPIVVAEPVIPFSKQDIKRILTACEYTTRTSPVSRKPYTQSRQTETRDKTMIYLLLDTGLRIGELSRLTLEDVFLDHNTLRVVPYHTGKKSRPREIPFGRATKRWLWQYITEYKPGEKRPIFGLTTTGMARLFTRLGKRAGIAKVHAHRFRHTFAIEFIRNSGDIFTLQYILGHSDLTMCRRYLAIVKADAQNAHARASPVDNWLE